jgi:hypothetical protein
MRRRLALLRIGSLVAVLASTTVAFAQPAAPVAGVQPFLRNWTRFEAWRYFDPPPPAGAFTPGDPSTDHIGNRLLAGVRLRRGILDGTVALQYVQFGGLPPDAIGPGALGTGALYFDHSGDTASHQVFLKTANVALRGIGGAVDVQIGRMPYTSGGERASGVPKIEAVKRQRIDSRLVGEFEWSLYQRSYDGVRVDWVADQIQVTATALQPTQGGFEEAAGVSMNDVRTFSAVVTTAPGAVIGASELQVFAHRYRDDRAVTARPDLSGRRVAAADIGITTIGAHVVGARPAGAGELDAMLWTAAQFGSWYEQRHRGFGLAAEAGYQWSRATWAPWLRAGFTWLSGDAAPTDESHGTFFPMLPTVRRYSQSTLYSLMNLRDVLLQAMLRPRGNLTLRVDAHLIGLASRGDGWYAGSGATQEEGRIFGYTLRPAGGESRLMDVVEGSAEWRFDPRWSVNAYVGIASRGPVVRTSFSGGPAVFVYLENVLQF